jgi:putative salt-induced outer membrane protein
MLGSGPVEGGIVKTLIRSLLLWCLVGAGVVLAQTPDCPCPVTPPPPPLWTGSGEFSWLATTGNSKTSSLGLGVDVFYKPAPWTFELAFAFLHSSTDEVTTAERFKGLLSASRDLTDRIDVFVKGAYLRDQFAGLDSLFAASSGAGFKLFNTPSQFLRVSAGFGYTWENQTIGVDRNYANAIAGLNYKWTFSKTAFFSNDFGFLLDLADTNNWFINDTAALTASLTSVFAIKASWTILYRHEPVPGFKTTDTTTAVSLVAKF